MRIGNAAQRQLQLDVYGTVAYAVRDYIEDGGELTTGDARLLRRPCRTVCERWREPDHGIWEMRGSRRHYTVSRDYNAVLVSYAAELDGDTVDASLLPQAAGAVLILIGVGLVQRRPGHADPRRSAPVT